jgi:hypothetical protein
MAEIQLSQHIYTSTTKGTLYPHRKGFQTVALTDDLMGSEELLELEMASFYSISNQRLREKNFPTKETFFRLSSGRMAMGRSTYSPPDDTGREGNFLTHHLIIEEADFKKIRGNPIYVLDHLKKIMSRKEYAVGYLPNLRFTLKPEEAQLMDFPVIPHKILVTLYTLLLSKNEHETPLLIGKPSGIRELLRAIYPTLPMQERKLLTFDTHFFQAEHLRERYALVAVESVSEIPTGSGYLPLYTEEREVESKRYRTPYILWLTDCIKERKWQEIETVNAILESGNKYRGVLPEKEEEKYAIAALWERGGNEIVPLLIGKIEAIFLYLRYVSDQQGLADALLQYSPGRILGAEPVMNNPRPQICLTAIRERATPGRWKEWVAKWKDDPYLTPFLPEKPKKSFFHW